MVAWHGYTDIYLGDRRGDPTRLRVGVVTVDRRTTIGLAQVEDNQEPVLKYTTDAEASTELISAIQRSLSDLIRLTGGFDG